MAGALSKHQSLQAVRVSGFRHPRGCKRSRPEVGEGPTGKRRAESAVKPEGAYPATRASDRPSISRVAVANPRVDSSALSPPAGRAAGPPADSSVPASSHSRESAASPPAPGCYLQTQPERTGQECTGPTDGVVESLWYTHTPNHRRLHPTTPTTPHDRSLIRLASLVLGFGRGPLSLNVGRCPT